MGDQFLVYNPMDIVGPGERRKRAAELDQGQWCELLADADASVSADNRYSPASGLFTPIRAPVGERT